MRRGHFRIIIILTRQVGTPHFCWHTTGGHTHRVGAVAVRSVRRARAGAMSAALAMSRGLVVASGVHGRADTAGSGTLSVPKPFRSIPPTAPTCDPPTVAEVNALAEFITSSQRLLVITGAGVSTESNVPDYRSPKGAYSTGFKPMSHQDFMRSSANQRRYWARSFAGWRRFAEDTSPNDAHHAIATLQHENFIKKLITQNVDRLHHAAGSQDVLELHGTTHEVVCLSCKHVSDRKQFQKTLARLNPELAEAADHTDTEHRTLKFRPDGDVELAGEVVVNFKVPPCPVCARGPLKPRVVFFGDSVPTETHHAATHASNTCDAVLIIGTSVSTFSAFRLVRDAARRNVPVAILTAGETRADDLASLTVKKLAGETLRLVLETVRRKEMYGY